MVAVSYKHGSVKQIGRYQVVKVLGHGGMGVVYRAEDPAIGRSVAIKTIRLGQFADPAERERLRARLLREARSAGRLSHPAIVTIYDVAEEGDTAYVFMEFVNGPTLQALLKSDESPARETILGILRRTAEALDYAHRMGIVHRDIKPANIMIGETGDIKITDFGVAKIQSEQMTKTGAILGTPHYMSPEQIQGSAVDGRSDQFALAVIAYEMLTGELPHDADTLATLVLRIVTEPPRAAHTFNPTLGDSAEEILTKALAKKPDHRYASCTEFAAALESALNARSDWQPLKHARPSAEEITTVDTQFSAPTVVAPESNLPDTAVFSPAPPPAAELPSEPAVPRPVSEEPPPPQAGPPRRFLTFRNAALVAVAILVLGLAGVAAWRSFSGSPPAEAAPPATKPSGTAAAANEQAPSPLAIPEAQAPSTTIQTSPSPPPTTPPAQTQATKPRTEEEAIQVSSNPAGATVVFDNNPQLTCTTPCSITLSTGRHTAALSLAGHRQALRFVEIPNDSGLSVTLERIVGTLECITDPPGAAITLNGRPRAEKTPARIALSPGTYKLELLKEGFPKYEGTVEVKDQVFSRIEINLGGSRP